MKYLGIDWGEKRIGLAIADEEIKIAIPFRTINHPSELINIIKEEEIDIIILGSPIKMNGDQVNNPQWLKFYNYLQDISIPISLIDERLSSLGADALPGDKKDKASRDEVAATIILQTYLDRNL